MERLGSIAITFLAIIALAMIAASIDTVSTEPRLEGDATLRERGGGCSGGGGGAAAVDCEPTAAGRIPGGPATASGPRTTVSDEETEPSTRGGPPRWQVVVGVGLFVLGGAAIVYALTRGETIDADVERDERAPDVATADAERALPATNVPLSNDVYRMWAALRARVGAEVGPAVTPAEVADAAVERRVPAADVEELTYLFCAIRYGGAAATERRQRRARELGARLDLEPGDDEVRP